MEKQQNVASHGNFLEQWSHCLMNSGAMLHFCNVYFFFFEKSMKKV
jgi:hypothetical protein